MDKSKTINFLFILYCVLGFSCHSQTINNHTEKDRLTLVSKIVLPNVSGRIDHISYDSANHLAFIAALGNNTVEIADINAKHVVKTITGVHEPQGVLFISALRKLVVANGDNGDCDFFNASTYSQTGIVHLKKDADNIRYDATSQLVYV